MPSMNKEKELHLSPWKNPPGKLSQLALHNTLWITGRKERQVDHHLLASQRVARTSKNSFWTTSCVATSVFLLHPTLKHLNPTLRRTSSQFLINKATLTPAMRFPVTGHLGPLALLVAVWNTFLPPTFQNTLALQYIHFNQTFHFSWTLRYFKYHNDKGNLFILCVWSSWFESYAILYTSSNNFHEPGVLTTRVWLDLVA